MFKKGIQQTDDNKRRRPLPIEQNKIFSYRASRAPEIESRNRLRPEATATQERSSRRLKWLSFRYMPTYIAVAAIAGCVVYNSVLSTSPRVIVSGGAGERALLKEAASYQTAIQSELKKSVLNRSKLTFNATTTTEQLTKQFPEIKDLRVSLPLIGQKPIIYVVPAQPRAILDTENGSYVLDERGKAITDATDRAPADTIRIRDDSGIQVKIGDQALPLQNIQFLEEVIHQFNAKNIVVTEASLPAGSQSVLLRIEGKPYQIKLSFQGDPLLQAGAFIAAYDRFSQTNTNPAQYVDVRVGDKVYFL